MKLGTKVLVRRGSPRIHDDEPGQLRLVRGTLVGAQGKQRTVRLDQDDTLAGMVRFGLVASSYEPECISDLYRLTDLGRQYLESVNKGK